MTRNLCRNDRHDFAADHTLAQCPVQKGSLQRVMNDLQVTAKVGYAGCEKKDGWEADKWTVTFKMDGRSYSTWYWMGLGHKQRRPKPVEVMESLMSDVDTLEDADGFEDWALNLGYDPNSRKDERTYAAVCSIRGGLAYLLGAAYERLRQTHRYEDEMMETTS